MTPDLNSLSKLTLILYPTNSISAQKPLLLYSSVLEQEIWHLSLIGPSVPERNMGQQETWWEGRWFLQDLQKLAPSQSLIELIHNIRQSFSEDDIALRGYSEGNENEIRLTIRYSIAKLAFDVPLTRLNLNNISESSHIFIQKPFLNLLEIICEHEHNARQARLNNSLKNNTHGINRPSPSIQLRTDVQNTRKKVIFTSTKDLVSRNLSNPCKKARTLVDEGFISSDDSS